MANISPVNFAESETGESDTGDYEEDFEEVQATSSVSQDIEIVNQHHSSNSLSQYDEDFEESVVSSPDKEGHSRNDPSNEGSSVIEKN